MTDLTDLLTRLAEYFDNRADADDGRPNDAMKFLGEIRAALDAVPDRLSSFASDIARMTDPCEDEDAFGTLAHLIGRAREITGIHKGISPHAKACAVCEALFVADDYENVCETCDEREDILCCRKCGDPVEDGGDGWNGMCGNCADKEEAEA